MKDKADEYGFFREKEMREALEHSDKLLRKGNRAAQILLRAENGESIEAALMESMELVGLSEDADRVHIWRNEMMDGELYFVNTYQWLSDFGRRKTPVPAGLKFPYKNTLEWQDKLLRGEHIQGMISEMPRAAREFLGSYDVKTIVVIPLFLQGHCWGFFSLDDLRRERTITDDEIDILRSISLMMASAVNRSAQAAKIREAHNRVNLLLNTAPFGVSLWNKDGDIFYCNEESAKIFGTGSAQEFCKRFYEFSPEYQPDGRLSHEKGAENLKAAFEKGHCVLEWMHQLPDGTLLPAEITLVRVEYENDHAVAAYLRDLREHKKMMEEIERRDILMNMINRAANILLQSGIDDFAKNLYSCMGMFAEALGVDRIAIWKNFTRENQLYYRQIFEWKDGVKAPEDNTDPLEEFASEKEPRSYSEAIPGWQKVLSEGNSINRLVRDMSRNEETHFVAQGLLAVFGVPVFVQDQFWGFVGYDNYHVERVFTENEQIIMRSGSLLIANALQKNDMMKNLQSTASQLETALEDTQRANNAKSTFLAKMSHEMRTPLNAVLGLTELTLNTMDPQGSREHYGNLERVYSAGATLLGIINDILDISKVEAGRLELVPVEYDVPSLINDIVAQNVMRIGEKPIELVLNIGEGMFTRLYGDELRIKQITSNLLTNAIKYTEEGTVELNMRCDLESDGRVWLTIQVRDTGLGIRPEDMDSLFINYAQVDLETNRKVEGTGLGLPLTKNLVELMGGSIGVESEYGQGSVFTARLRQKFVTDAPIGPDVVESLKKFHYSDGRLDRNIRFKRVSLPYARVLIVDDNPTNLDVAKGLMKPYGMRIDCLNGGQKAVDAIRAEEVRYNAVFMDHMMPGLDGMEATRAIREIGTDYAKNLPVIALTANAIAGNEEMFLSRGFQAFLSKPIDIFRLDEVIRRWVRDKELEKTRRLSGEAPPAPGSLEGGLDLGSRQLAGLDLKRGLELFGGSAEVYLGVLRSYAANTRPLLESIKNPAGLADYAVIVHGIKGSSRGIFAGAVGEAAAELEKAAQDGDFAYVAAHNPAFLEAAWKLINELEDMLAAIEAGNPKPMKSKPDPGALSKLLAACQAYDMDGVDAAMAELESCRYESGQGLALWLRENVDRMNFAEIVEKLSSTRDSD